MTPVDVKICGINDPYALKAAVRGGTNYIGLNFYPPSPRFVPIETAVTLSGLCPDQVKVVGLFVDPTDDDLAGPVEYAWLDLIQLHGGESPERVRAIREKFGVPVIKAFRLAAPEDLAATRDFESVADWFLFDARPADAALPGGTGQSFDWNILAGYECPKPWMLSGGLNAANIEQALETLAPDVVDLASGIEDEPGRKSPEKIAEFFDVMKRTRRFKPNYLKAT